MQLPPSGLSVHWKDGRVLVVGSFRQTDLDLWSLPIDPLTHAKRGEPVTRFASTFGERHMRFSHDGRKLAFVSARSGYGELWIAEDGELRRLTDHRATILSSPRWSPDDRQVVYRISAAGEPNVMYVIDVVSGMTRRLRHGSPSFWLGDYLYYDELSTNDSGATLMRMRMPDGEPERLFPGAVAVASTEGTRILYAKKEPGIFARTLTGNAVAEDEVRLVDDYVIMRGATAPVADGFYYVGHVLPAGVPTAIKFYDYATQTAKEVHRVPLDIDIGMAISPDGTELLYSAGSGDPQADLTVLEIDELAAGAAK
jgi:dipeptidyl aminopeptidase/acylaminoacyl peptidase